MDLSDGSRIIGIPSISSVPIQTSFAKVNVPLTQIASMKMDTEPETAAIEMTNGDKLKGVIGLGTVQLMTIIGKVPVEIGHVRNMRVRRIMDGYFPAELKEGLVLQYSFDENDGGKITDTSGQGNHGSSHNAIPASDRFGSPGRAYSFNGVDSYIRASADGLPTRDRTIAFWYYADTASGGRGLLGYGGGASFLMVINNQDAGQNQYETQGHSRINRMNAPMGADAVGMWHHWAVTIHGNRITMFVDGTQIGTADVFSVPTGVKGKDFIIGTCVRQNGIGTYTDSNGTWFSGKPDDVLIYDRALSSKEIGILAGSN